MSQGYLEGSNEETEEDLGELGVGTGSKEQQEEQREGKHNMFRIEGIMR